MSESVVPWREQAIASDEAAKLFGLTRERFLRNIACLPTFPERVNLRPATWIVGEVLDWRDHYRASHRERKAAA